eukprot:2566479-Rhodomonas_salina.4
MWIEWYPARAAASPQTRLCCCRPVIGQCGVPYISTPAPARGLRYACGQVEGLRAANVFFGLQIKRVYGRDSPPQAVARGDSRLQRMLSTFPPLRFEGAREAVRHHPLRTSTRFSSRSIRVGLGS